MEELPQRLADPATVVFWDKGLSSQRNPNPGLVYAWPLPDGRWVRVVFGVNEDRGDRAMRQAGQRENWLRSAHIIDQRDLRRPGYELIRGTWE